MTSQLYPNTHLDSDEEYFREHAGEVEWLRKAHRGEWPEDNELLTSPPFTLVVRVSAKILIKFGSWRSNANVRNTFVQLAKGRIPVSTYLDYLRKQERNAIV